MKITLRILTFTILLGIIFSTKSFAWSNAGHMAVAYVAYQNLKPLVRDRVDALVKLNPKYDKWLSTLPAGTSTKQTRTMLFMIAATWADQIKSDGHVQDGSDSGNTPPNDGTADQNIGYSDSAMHKYWHFIDLPFTRDGTTLQNPAVPNAQTQIAAFRAVLASDANDDLKSYDLVWLLHLIGDVHQPLHCTARFSEATPHGDDGGNGVKICTTQCGDSLHTYWDGIFGTSGKPKHAIQVATGLHAAPAALAGDLRESVWIDESFKSAKQVVYRNPPIGKDRGPFQITASYRSDAITLASKRVALAGARLAKILNTELH